MLTEVLGEVLLPRLMSRIVNEGVLANDHALIIQTGLLMIVSTVIMLIGGVGGNYFATKSSVNFAADLRRDVFHKVQRFSFEDLDHYSTGSLVTRLTNDITQIQNVLRLGLIALLRSPGMLIGALIMAISINGKLALVIAVVIPLLILSIGLVMKTAFPRFQAMQKKLDGLNSSIQESLTNIRVVKSFVRDDFEVEKFSKSNGDLKEATLRAMDVVIMTMPIMTLFMNVTVLAVVWFGGQFVIAGGMQVGDLTAFVTYVTQILMSLMMLSMILMQASRAGASLRRITEILDAKVTLTDEAAKHPQQPVQKGRVEFRDVSFTYRADHSAGYPVLEHVSFTAEPGQVIGILGATGSGKTSLVQLIPRLYDVSSGQVLVDGVDVRDYTLRELRDGVGMVLQKNVLFSGTIAENLHWGDEDATEEELMRYAEHAQAAEFIDRMPDGYQTELEEGGSNVSGGQKQRLCIARALLKRPKILILDDSTSAVDTATEAKIRESFSNELRDTTVFIIAQRITSVMDADRILLLDNGTIAAQGTHEELMRSSEAYREIYYSQRDQEEDAV
jgi:ATP-binding cassette subfamily B multidrug efflux pump